MRCVSICGNIRPTSEGRVLDFEDKEFIGLAVKVKENEKRNVKMDVQGYAE